MTSAGIDAFCDAAYSIEEVHAPSLLDWCEIAFEAETPGDPPIYESNPALYADLYVGNELLTGRVEFPKELTKVNSLTFANRERLKAIPDNAFSRCESLDGIVIPESVETIGYAAFFDCKSLQSINVPDAVTKSEVGAFAGCDSLNAVHITVLDRIGMELVFAAVGVAVWFVRKKA